MQPQDEAAATPLFHLSRESVLSTALLRQAIQQAGAGQDEVSAPCTDDAFLTALRSVCTECLDKLVEYRSASPFQQSLLALAGAKDTQDNGSQESFSAVQATSDLLAAILGSCNTLPEPDIGLQASLVQALVSKTSIAVEGMKPKIRLASVSAKRWMLASLLKHYLGTGPGFGQHNSASGAVRYAIADRDDAAIRVFFSRPGSISIQAATPTIMVPASLVDGRPKRSGSVKSTDTQLSLDAAAKAEAQQTRRDDKLRWLFGENVSSKTLAIAKSYASTSGVLSPTSPFMPPTPGKYSRLNHRRPDALRFPGAAVPIERAPLSPPHRRAWSAGSESTFRTAGVSPSEPSFSPTMGQGLVRRPSAGLAGLTPQEGNRTPTTQSSSNDDLDSLATGTPNNSGTDSRNSLTRFSSIDTCDSSSALLSGQHRRFQSSGGNHLSEVPYRGPFQSGLVKLDEASESSPPNTLTVGNLVGNKLHRSNSTSSTRSEPPFQRREDLPLPPTTNVLTPKEKQNLVRKSRKLKAVLGDGADEARLMQKQHTPRCRPVVSIHVASTDDATIQLRSLEKRV